MHNVNELQHYGVKGMKWGVRRGNLSVRTTNRIGENYSERYKNKMKRSAKKLLVKERKKTEREAENQNRYATMAENRGDMARAKAHRKAAEAYVKRSSMLNKTLYDIDSGKMKAGKDYVANYESSTNLVFDALGFLNVSTKTSLDWREKRK